MKRTNWGVVYEGIDAAEDGCQGCMPLSKSCLLKVLVRENPTEGDVFREIYTCSIYL